MSDEATKSIVSATYAKYRMPSLRTSDVKDISTWSLWAIRMVLQVLTQVTIITMASETIMHDLVAIDTVIRLSRSTAVRIWTVRTSNIEVS